MFRDKEEETPMNAQQNSNTTQGELQIGQPYGGGFFIGITQENGKLYRNIQASKVFQLKGVLRCYGQDVEGAHSYTDSRANTEAYAAAGSKLAQQALKLEIDHRTDWAIPARDVVELQYRNLKPTTHLNWCSWRDGDNPSSVPVGYPYTRQYPPCSNLVAFSEGGPEAFDTERWYASSTQYSAHNACIMDFCGGYQHYGTKYGERYVRPVRRELIE